MNKLTVFQFSYFRMFVLAFIFVGCGQDEDLVGGACQGLSDEVVLTEGEELFLNLVFGEESGEDIPRLIKWTQNINLFVEGTPNQEQLDELDVVIDELNTLGNTIEISVVNDVEISSLRLFFGTREDYVALFEPNIPSIIPDGISGLVNIARDDSFEIKETSIWIDNINFPDFEFQQHAIREQMARSLGLVNGITSLDDSIFNQMINTNRSYSQLDREMISLMLDNQLKPGFCPNTIVRIIE